METLCDTRLVRRSAVAERQIGDERLLVPVRTSVSAPLEVLALNESATLLWEALAEPRDLQSLVDAVCDAFDVDPASARADVEDFLGELIRRDLVERRQP